MISEQEIMDVVGKQRSFFNSSATHSYEFRIDQLKKFKEGMKKFEGQIIAALKDDLGKSEFESYFTEAGLVLHDLTHTIKSLKKWMKPTKRSDVPAGV